MRALVTGLLALALFSGCDKGAKQYGDASSSDNPVAVYGSCAYCHVDLATNMVATGGHASLDVSCQLCHDNVAPDNPGPGHATIPVCGDCHGMQVTHNDPQAGTQQECLVCHTPHGSPNLTLINTIISTPGGDEAPIEFDNVAGLADGSYASPSAPGTGLCEVCHTDTLYYRNDGTGAPHFAFSCHTCHPHSQGFAPE